VPLVLITYILPRSTSASATRRRRAHLSVRAFGVLLLDVGVEGWVAQISLRAVGALEIAPIDVILRTTLSFGATLHVVTIPVTVVVAIVVGLLAMRNTAQQMSLVFADCTAHVWSTSFTGCQLAAPRLAVLHHVLLARSIVHVSHLQEVASTVSVRAISLLLVETGVLAHHTLAWRSSCHHHWLLADETLS
jgi:hypothetical protein